MTKRESVFREGIPALGLFLAKGTKDTPADGRFHVLLNGKVQASFSSERRARDAYQSLRDRLVDETGYKTDFVAASAAEVIRKEAHEAALRESKRDAQQAGLKSRIRKGRSRTYG